MTPKPEFVEPLEERSKRDGLLLTSGFRKYPVGRDAPIQHPVQWMKGKQEVDGAYPYWRVHDKLYDLAKFVDRHPGGKFWLEITQGTDITEVFESSHFGGTAEKVLQKYFVKDVSTPRNSPFTFHENGFYKTLKKKVTPILKDVGKGPYKSVIYVQDSLLFGVLFFAVLASWRDCAWLAAISGSLAALAAITSHNFFHQKDNWRMYIFDMMLFSSRDWRITHVLSHHVFPNTIYDFEISNLEPTLELLPKSNKSLWNRTGAVVTAFVFFSFALFLERVHWLVGVVQQKVKFGIENSIPLIELLVMVILNGSLRQGLWLWLVFHIMASIVFFVIGLTAAHHHPEIYHDGDEAPQDKDWGIHQLIATRERGEVVMNSIFLSSISFGNHTLHHLFPTIDLTKLHYLQPALLETCKEFGIKFDVHIFSTWKLFKGWYLQLLATKPNTNVQNCFK